MITLTREKGKRMWGGGGASAAGGGGSDMSGFASQGWVDENYLSKSFFSTLFIIHATQTVTVTDNQGQPVGEPVVTEITLAPNQLPGTTSVTDEQGNTTTTVIALESIEATTNFYSDGGVSALGLSSGGGGGGASALTDLVDVAISSPTNGQVLMYNSSTGKWYNGNVQSGGGGTVTSITAGTGLTGGTITTSGTIALSQETQAAIAAGVTAYGWGDHSQAGYLKQTDISDMATKTWVGQQGYLTSSALTGYATQSWVQQQGYLTSSAISDMATKTWVGQQGYLTSSAISDMATKTWVNNQGFLTQHQTVSGTFWGQAWSNHGSVSGDMTNVGRIFQTGNYTLMNYQGIGLMIEGSAVTGSEYRATFGFHPANYLTWLDTYVMQLKINTTTGEKLVYINNGILQIGDARLVWDSANNALKVINADGTAANLYATGGVSALGMSAGVSSIDAMTFGYLKVNDKLAFGNNQALMYKDDYLYIECSDTISVNTVEFDHSGSVYTNGSVRAARFYLDSNRYLYVSGGTLYYYNGSTSKQVAFTN